MSFTQIDLDKSTVFGSGSINRISTPSITASIRRKNPDMSSTVPYYPSLNTKTITVVQAGTFSGTTTITFTSDNYAQALTDINTAGASNFTGVDTNGYLTIKSSYSGDRNSIKITGGTALSILGIDAFPHPGGVSYAGEIGSVTPNIYEGRSIREGVTIQNEALNRENLNRGLATVGYILDTLNVNLDREIAVPREFDVTINGTSFSISSDERLCINANNILVSQPSSDQIDNVVCILDSFHNQIFSDTGDRVRVTSITYGTLVNATQSFASWNTVDGKQVFGALSHFQKVKGTYTIQSISGNTVTITGDLISDKVQPNDTISISGATNLSPFNHNGEFIVDKILSSTVLQVRPKGSNDFNLFNSTTPSSLNQILNVGEVYGTVTAYVGKFIPLIMKSGNMVFNLSSSLPNGTYKVRLSVGRTLKQLLQEDMSASDIISPYGGQLEIGSKLISTLSNALKPRIISKPNGDVDRTLFAEFYNTAVSTVGTRIYLDKTGGIELIYNGKWNGITFNKDDVSKDIVYMKEDETAVFYGTSTFSTNLDYINQIATMGSSTMYIKLDEVANTAELTRGNQKLLMEDVGGTVSAKMINSFDINDQTTTVLSVPDFDGLSTSKLTAKSGINLGTGFTTDMQHLIEKINYTCNSSANTYTLLNETTLSTGRLREYVLDTGTSVKTINAKWSGTQWIKDSSSFSSKVITDLDNVKFLIHESTTTPFSDAGWTNIEEIKNFQFYEEFINQFSNASDTINKTVGGLFFVATSPVNTKTYLNLSPDVGSVGEIIISSETTMSTYSVDIRALSINVGTGDFEFRIKTKVIDSSSLGSTIVGQTGGLILGNNSADAGYLAFKTNVTSLWSYQIGSNLIPSAISSTGPSLLTFKRVNQMLFTYINNALVDARTHTVNFNFTPSLYVDGTSTLSNQNIVSIDFVKFWTPGIYK